MIRLARPEEADAVRQLSAEAYVPAYVPLFGRAPMPAREDYAPRIARGEVWVMQVDEQLAAALVLEDRSSYLLVYSIAIRPAFQRRGFAAELLSFADQQAAAKGFGEIRLYTNEKCCAIRRSTGAPAIAKSVAGRIQVSPACNSSTWRRR